MIGGVSLESAIALHGNKMSAVLLRTEIWAWMILSYLCNYSASSTLGTSVCLTAKSDMKVLYRKEPPFQKDSFRDRCGLLCDLVKAGLNHCFEHRNCITSTVWTEVSSKDEFWTYIANETVDIALPIDPYISSPLAEKLLDSNGDNNITLIPVLKSPGLAMVIDYSVCKNRVQQLTTNTILSTWPICAAMLLLAGISGIFIWALVRVVAD